MLGILDMQYMAEKLEEDRNYMITKAERKFEDVTERKEVIKTIIEVYDRTFIALSAACGMGNGGIPSEKRSVIQIWPKHALHAMYPRL